MDLALVTSNKQYCLVNEKTIGFALQSYTSDYNGYYPSPAERWGTPGHSWVQELTENSYMNGYKLPSGQILGNILEEKCPSNVNYTRQSILLRQPANPYLMTGETNWTGHTGLAGQNRTSIAAPSQTVEVICGGNPPGVYGLVYQLRDQRYMAGTYQPSRNKISQEWHGDGIPTSFTDGHAAFIDIFEYEVHSVTQGDEIWFNYFEVRNRK